MKVPREVEDAVRILSMIYKLAASEPGPTLMVWRVIRFAVYVNHCITSLVLELYYCHSTLITVM